MKIYNAVTIMIVGLGIEDPKHGLNHFEATLGNDCGNIYGSYENYNITINP